VINVLGQRPFSELLKQHFTTAVLVDLAERNLSASRDAPCGDLGPRSLEADNADAVLVGVLDLSEHAPQFEILVQVRQQQTEFLMSHVVGIGILAVFLACSLGGLECTHDDGFGIEDVMESDHITAALVHLGKGEKPVAVGVELLEELHALALIFRCASDAPRGDLGPRLSEVHNADAVLIGVLDLSEHAPQFEILM